MFNNILANKEDFPDTPFVFLGGTCNGSTWRDSLIKLLKVKYFNPVVENWNENAIRVEEIAKNNASALLYVITPKQTGFYGLVEAVMSTFTCFPHQFTMLAFITEEDGLIFDEGQLKSISAVKKLLSENTDIIIMDNLKDIAKYLNDELT